MTDSIILDPQELTIAKEQCEGCRWWSWFKGCFYNNYYPLPRQDCGAFEETP
ncbi:hypothetical protein LCGC14_1491880 [marine sediment metagenome]|uniref:Uncharacterized protein n=1 Tax=marine sediment metagenome TaxID=412755 RepID=A0A0F9J794_9ZZZZ